jgi:hypothetical protein
MWNTVTFGLEIELELSGKSFIFLVREWKGNFWGKGADYFCFQSLQNRICDDVSFIFYACRRQSFLASVLLTVQMYSLWQPCGQAFWQP